MIKVKKALIIIFMMVIFYGLIASNNVFVYADDVGVDVGSEVETPSPETGEEGEGVESGTNFVDGVEILVSKDIKDEKLYSVLVDELEKKGYKGSSIYANSFVDFTELDLSKKGIVSLEGLGNLNFKGLISLNLAENNIENVTAEMLSTMPNIQILNLSGNKLNSIDLSQIQTLKNINLMANQLKELNVGNLRVDNVDINLSGNVFTNMSDITMPSRINKIKINVLSNNIVEIDESYFDWDKLTLNVGIQGFKNEKIISVPKAQKLKIYKTNIDNCEIKIYKKNGLNNDIVETFSDNLIEGDYKELSLGVGEYTYDYLIDGEVVYKPNDEKFNIPNSIYKGYSFIVIPNAPSYLLEYKGKTYESLNKVTGAVKVLLSADEGEVMYSVNGGAWNKGLEVMCDDGGNYSVKAKVVVSDGDDIYESEITEVFVKTSLNSMISDGLMLALVLLLTLTLFLVIVPIVSKKYFKR